MTIQKQRPILQTDEECQAQLRKAYVDDVIGRAEMCQVTGELPYPLDCMPLPAKVIALMIADKYTDKYRR